jgi:hypothetical protein
MKFMTGPFGVGEIREPRFILGRDDVACTRKTPPRRQLAPRGESFEIGAAFLQLGRNGRISVIAAAKEPTYPGLHGMPGMVSV